MADVPLLTFPEMLRCLLLDGVFSQAHIAKRIGISKSRMSDLLSGKRRPSVRTVNAICEYMGRGPRGRLEWHRAAARTYGWEI